MITKSFRGEEKTFQDLREVREIIQEGMPSDVKSRSVYRKEGAHLRALVDREVRRWKKAPYIAVSCQKFLHVTAGGDFVYWSKERLHLNQRGASVTSRLQMNHAKMAEYLKRVDESGEDPTTFLRRQWKFHYFRFVGLDGTPGATHVDQEGITDKEWTAVAPRAEGAGIIREVGCHVTGYCQFRKGEEGLNQRDGFQANILVPTGVLELVVIVDVDLFRHTTEDQGRPILPGQSTQRPRVLKGGLVNLETDGFRSDDQWHGYEPLMKIANGVAPEVRDGDQGFLRAHEMVEDFAEQSRQFFDAAATDPTMQEVPSHSGYRSPELPERYYLYVLRIEDVDPGERIIVSWPLPTAHSLPKRGAS